MFTIQAHVLRMRAHANEPIVLAQHPGSAIRGAFFGALWGRFCVNKESLTCTTCPLVHSCPVSMLVAPLRDENPRGRDIPRPFVIEPPQFALDSGSAERTRLERGSTFAFGLTLLGAIVTQFPYLVLATQVMEQNGLGSPLDENRGRRGRPRIERIECVDPFGEQTEALYIRGEKSIRTPEMAVTAQAIANRAARFPTDHLTVHFLTPTRLIADGQIMHTPHLNVLAQRLLERLDALEEAYGHAGTDEESNESRRARHHEMGELARQVRLVANDTRWVDVSSYSSRQRRATPIGGFVGRATYDGDLTALRELLAWGEVVHVGKNTVKGDGLYRVEW